MTEWMDIVLTRESFDDEVLEYEYRLNVEYEVLGAEPSVGLNRDIEIISIIHNGTDFPATPDEIEWLKDVIYRRF